MCSLYLGENLISGNKPINLGVRNIGEIVASPLPLTDAGLHLLDGSLILGGGIYQGFVDYIADLYTDNPTANYFTDETTWQNSVTAYGVCGKFVYDSVANTVRLPKITGKIEGTTDVTALGDLAEQYVKLPNITGSFVESSDGAGHVTSGAFSWSSYGGGWTSGGTGGSRQTISLDASRSSSVYSGNGTDTTIHEQAIKAFYYIVIANSTKTDIQVDIDEITTDLNGKADTDLTNITDTGYIKMAGASMPSGRYINLTLGASGATYTAPADGWVILSATTTSSTNYAYGLYNSTNGTSSLLRINAIGVMFSTFIPVAKGDVFNPIYEANITGFTFRFIYAQGSESEAS